MKDKVRELEILGMSHSLIYLRRLRNCLGNKLMLRLPKRKGSQTRQALRLKSRELHLLNQMGRLTTYFIMARPRT